MPNLLLQYEVNFLVDQNGHLCLSTSTPAGVEWIEATFEGAWRHDTDGSPRYVTRNKLGRVVIETIHPSSLLY